MAEAITLIDLPDLVLEKIFSYLTYDNIAQNRLVCTKFNIMGGKLLNKGYYMADRFHGRTLKAIKAKLPRRESERRIHPLARQCDILIAIETRLSMLSMTFTKWIDANLCCFIPGKVIDEIMRVLRCVANNPSPPRTHEILQELRDISSMAMEHFDEKILPSLKLSVGVPHFLPADNKSRLAFLIKFYRTKNEFEEATHGERIDFMNLRKKIINERFCRCPIPQQFHKWIAAYLLQYGSSSTDDELALVPVNKRIFLPIHPPTTAVSVVEFNKLLVRESLNRKKIKAQSEMISKQANEITELRRHVEEWEAKLRDLTTNLIKAKDLPATSTLVPTSRKRKRKSSRTLAKKVKNAEVSKKKPIKIRVFYI